MSGSTFSKQLTVEDTKEAYKKATDLSPNKPVNATGSDTQTAEAAADAIDLSIKKALNNLAQAKFFELKYMDRTGSLNLLFSPNWVPGTTGTAFSRYPDPDGMFVDFYVTQVKHSFAPGSATTQVSFAGGRMGETPVGLDKYELFNYDSKKMQEMQKKYIADFRK